MNPKQLARESDYAVRRFEYDDETVLAVDFGPERSDAAVDVVDDTAIVVLDDEQYELDLPLAGTDAHTFIRNGVLSIEMEANA